MLLELTLDQSDCQTRAVDGHVDGFEHICKSADMVLVTVGDNDTLYALNILFKVSEIGKNEVYTEHIGVREGKTAVNEDNVVFVLVDGNILADFVKSAKEAYLNGLYLFRLIEMLVIPVILLFVLLIFLVRILLFKRILFLILICFFILLLSLVFLYRRLAEAFVLFCLLLLCRLLTVFGLFFVWH